MTDKELLELAAKAAGYEINFDEPLNNYYPHGYDDNGDVDAWWNPLTNDGDALRLAADLRLTIEVFDKQSVAHTYFANNGRLDYVMADSRGDDRRLNTRTAIVRTAARIGKAMP
jgi:hypothetical protein